MKNSLTELGFNRVFSVGHVGHSGGIALFRCYLKEIEMISYSEYYIPRELMYEFIVRNSSGRCQGREFAQKIIKVSKDLTEWRRGITVTSLTYPEQQEYVVKEVEEMLTH